MSCSLKKSFINQTILIPFSVGRISPRAFSVLIVILLGLVLACGSDGDTAAPQDDIALAWEAWEKIDTPDDGPAGWRGQDNCANVPMFSGSMSGVFLFLLAEGRR